MQSVYCLLLHWSPLRSLDFDLLAEIKSFRSLQEDFLAKQIHSACLDPTPSQQK